MTDDEKRVNIEDLPMSEEKLTDDDAKEVKGGSARAGVGILKSTDGGATWGNTVGGSLGANAMGGSLGDDPSNPGKK